MPIVLLGPTAGAPKSFHGMITELLERTASGYESQTTSNLGGLDQYIDIEAEDVFEPTTSYTGGYVRLVDSPMNDVTRRVGIYDNSSGTFTVGRAFPNTVPSGMTYQFSELLNFRDLKKCINVALAEGYFRDKAYMDPPEVAMVALPSWILERGQLIDIYYGYARSDQLGDLNVTPVKNWWWFDQSGDTPGRSEQQMIVGVDPIDQAATSMVIDAIRPFPPLLNDTDVTEMDLEWLMAGAKFHFYETLVRRAGKSDVTRYAGLMSKELAKWNTHLWSRQPHDPTPLKFKFPHKRVGNTNMYPSWVSVP